MSDHDHNLILGLYGTPRATIRSRGSTRQGHAATFQSGRPSKERQFDHQLDLPQRPRADKPVAVALSRTFQRGCLFARSPRGHALSPWRFPFARRPPLLICINDKCAAVGTTADEIR